MHSSFGTGVVGHVGVYKGELTVWIDFDYGQRHALSVEYGGPHLSQRRRWSRRTPPQPDLRCEVCGERPLVLNAHGQKLCHAHTSQFHA
jgi:hypothetical protein